VDFLAFALEENPEGWLAEFAASLANSGLAPLTVRAYRHDVDLFLKWFAAIKGGKSRLSDLTTADVLSYRQHLVNVTPLRSSTINQRLQAIRCLCRWAERQGFLKSNPAAVVKSLRVAKRRRRKIQSIKGDKQKWPCRVWYLCWNLTLMVECFPTEIPDFHEMKREAEETNQKPPRGPNSP
jgi:hypothetical protein